MAILPLTASSWNCRDQPQRFVVSRTSQPNEGEKADATAGQKRRGLRRSKHCDCGPWEVLRPLLRKMRVAQNHPHYVANGNEHPTLTQLIAADPPAVGLGAYIDDIEASDG